ncbi:unnamed protein product, partial [Brenthis ino]
MSCRICHKRHHSLLHQPSKSNTLDQSEKQAQPTVSVYANVEESEREEINAMMTSHYNGRQSSAMLATAEVVKCCEGLKSEEGNIIMLRALIDQGSEASFISEKAAQLLKLSRQPARGNVVGMGSTRTSVNQRVQLQVSPRWESQFSIHIQAYVISKQLTSKIPHTTVKGINWQHIKGLNLADPNYYKPSSIDLLLGVKEYSKILNEGLIKGVPGTPCAQYTDLGWILFGEINTSQESFLVMHNQIYVDEIYQTIKYFINYANVYASTIL